MQNVCRWQRRTREERFVSTFSIRYRESMWHRRWLAGPSDHTRYTPLLSVTTIATTYASHGSFAWRTPPYFSLGVSPGVGRYRVYSLSRLSCLYARVSVCVCVCVGACTRSFLPILPAHRASREREFLSFSLQTDSRPPCLRPIPLKDLQTLLRPVFRFFLSFREKSQPRSFIFFFFFVFTKEAGCFSSLSTRARRLGTVVRANTRTHTTSTMLYNRLQQARACLRFVTLHGCSSASNREFLASLARSFFLLLFIDR